MCVSVSWPAEAGSLPLIAPLPCFFRRSVLGNGELCFP